MTTRQTLRLADYTRPAINVDTVDLDFQIHDDHTICTSRVSYFRDGNHGGYDAKELVLNAENPNPQGQPFIRSVKIDGFPLGKDGYQYDEKAQTLTIALNDADDEFEIEIETYLEPQNNTLLTGLYASDSVITTQCESEGFRRITPFLDRPDVMAIYNVRVEADRKKYPVLLANGNKMDEGRLDNGRHYATFSDPWPKPSYLFCTASGNLDVIEDTFETMSGRNVAVRVFTERGDKEKGWHALDALKLSMKWDEDVFGCEYDLDDYNVVSVAKFTFGAMENKGLNIFRDSLVLADPNIATDGNYQRITDVIGHEYFHNWSGNRVTLANWFNISLKEGLTVMREQMFTAFTTSDALERIGAVSVLRAGQFVTDDGPLAHPVMPQEVESVENCYTSTIYEKGSEVLRMMKVMMGEEKFIEGVKHYFKTYDGQAVTIEEFKKSMEKVSGLDFSGQFDLWYTQAGRPRVKAEGVYDATNKTYTIKMTQNFIECQKDNAPMMIPVLSALVDGKGNQIGEEKVLLLTEKEQEFVFEKVEGEPAFHSLLRGMSAPVTLDPGLSEDQLYMQMRLDTDGFNRWDAGQKLALAEMVKVYDAFSKGKQPKLDARLVEAHREIWSRPARDLALQAEMLSFPTIKELEGSVNTINPALIAKTRKFLVDSMARELQADVQTLFDGKLDLKNEFEISYDEVGRRRMYSKSLAMLSTAQNGSNSAQLEAAYFTANNMTDRLAAMNALKDYDLPSRTLVFDDFYQKFKKDSLTVQKWFMLQAGSDIDGVIDKVRTIMDSKTFDWTNPGHIQSIMGGFVSNYGQFHAEDGSGYMFLAEVTKKMDKINGTTASRFVDILARWQQYDETTSALMLAALKDIAKEPNLSKQVGEKVFKALPKDSEAIPVTPEPAP